MRSLSVVYTAMQLVNCIEAIKQYGSTINDLLILSGIDRSGQIDKLLDEYSPYFSFSKITRLKFSKYNQLNVIKEFLLLKSASSNVLYDIVFVTNYKQSRQKFLLRGLSKKNTSLRIVLVDDGLAVCEIVSKRNQEYLNKKANVYYSSRLYKLLYKGFVKNYIPKRIEYFTVYNNLEIVDADTIVLNQYNFIKNNTIGISPNIDPDKSLIVLGQPLVGSYGMGGLNKDKYCAYIRDAISSIGMNDHIVYYFPHPVEDTHITLTEEMINYFHIQYSSVPFEIISLKIDNRTPVLGFYTSALVNLRKFDNERVIYSVYFDDVNDSPNPRFKKIVNEAYDYMKSIGITILNRNNAFPVFLCCILSVLLVA